MIMRGTSESGAAYIPSGCIVVVDQVAANFVDATALKTIEPECRFLFMAAFDTIGNTVVGTVYRLYQSPSQSNEYSTPPGADGDATGLAQVPAGHIYFVSFVGAQTLVRRPLSKATNVIFRAKSSVRS